MKNNKAYWYSIFISKNWNKTGKKLYKTKVWFYKAYDKRKYVEHLKFFEYKELFKKYVNL